jgi:hypothetical protein
MPATARIADVDRARLIRLARETGQSQLQVIGKALAIYEREQFFELMDAGYEALQADEAAWAEVLKERELWDETLTDRTIGT